MTLVETNNPTHHRQDDIEQEKDTQESNNNGLTPIQHLTVEELYDKDKYDLSTMEPGDVFTLLQ